MRHRLPAPLSFTAPERSRWVAFAVLVLAVYLASRWALLYRLPYFIDEGTHARFAYLGDHSLHDLFVSETIGKEPLLIWLAILLMKLGISSLTAVRLSSVISGALTIPIVWLLGARLAGNRTGAIAAAGCVVLPFFLVHDAIGIMEPLLTLLLMAALYLEIRLAQRPALVTGIALGVVLAAAYLTKESGEIALALMPLSLVCFDWEAPDRRRRLIVWLGCVVIAVALTGAADLLLRSSAYYANFQATRASAFLYPVRSLTLALAHPLRWWRVAWPVYRPALLGYVGAPTLVAALLGIGLRWRRDWRSALLITGWVVAMFGAAVLFPVSPYPRHILYLVPLLLIPAADAVVRAAGWVSERVPGRLAGPLVAVGVALLLAPVLRLDARVLAHPASAPYPGADEVQYVTGPQAGSPWAAVAGAIRRGAGGRHVIVALDSADADVVKGLLRHSPRYTFVDGSTTAARAAQFLLRDELPFPDPAANRLLADGGFQLIERLPRPDGGAVVSLYERARAR